jgi:hypothetical protein
LCKVSPTSTKIIISLGGVRRSVVGEALLVSSALTNSQTIKLITFIVKKENRKNSKEIPLLLSGLLRSPKLLGETKERR